MNSYLLLFIVIIVMSIIIIGVLFYNDFLWNKKKRRNFPIQYRGGEFWVSRSVAVTLVAFCKNDDGKWCILTNQRGSGTPNFKGLWNVPCGYLDYDETGEQAAQREAYEETGVYASVQGINLFRVNTDPNDGKEQNVSLQYYTVLDKPTSEYEFSKERNEKDEVEEIKWIEIDDIDKYQWAFNHDKIVTELFNKIQPTLK